MNASYEEFKESQYSINAMHMMLWSALAPLVDCLLYSLLIFQTHWRQFETVKFWQNPGKLQVFLINRVQAFVFYSLHPHFFLQLPEFVRSHIFTWISDRLPPLEINDWNGWGKSELQILKGEASSFWKSEYRVGKSQGYSENLRLIVVVLGKHGRKRKAMIWLRVKWVKNLDT